MTINYDNVILKDDMEIEAKRKICIKCVDIEITPNPHDKYSPNGVRVVPKLNILNIEALPNGEVMVHWICPKCKTIRLKEKYSSINEVAISLFNQHNNLVAETKAGLSKSAILIANLIKDKMYNKLPGYVISLAARMDESDE